MLQNLLKTSLYLSVALFVSVQAFGKPQISEASAMVEANIYPRSWNDNLAFMKDFASANEAFCKTWSSKAFEVQPDLHDSCQFAPLLRRYLAKLNALKNESASGVVMPEVPLKNATLPVLQSGAWQALLMSDVEGTDSALELIVLRIALEKSLKAHAKMIRSQSFGVFNSFAALTVPRMIASFSAYSMTLQRLVLIDSFECGAEKTRACTEVKTKLGVLKSELLAGIGPENFLAGLENLTEENSSRAQLKSKKVRTVAGLIEVLKSKVSLKDILKSLKGSKVHPVFHDLKTEMNLLTSNGLGASSGDQSGMLVAVSILSEISELQKRTSGVPVAVRAGNLAKRTTEEMSQLQSLVLKVLMTDEVTP